MVLVRPKVKLTKQKQIIKKQGLSEKQVRSIAKSKGYSDAQIDKIANDNQRKGNKPNVEDLTNFTKELNTEKSINTKEVPLDEAKVIELVEQNLEIVDEGSFKEEKVEKEPKATLTSFWV